MAEHCARLWLQAQAVDLTLIGRNADRVRRVAADLRVRNPQSDIKVIESDFMAANAIRSTVDAIVTEGPVDIVLIAHGSLPAQAECQDDLNICCEALVVNGLSPVMFAESFAKHMGKINYGTLALIGSVAGDRGRKSNYVYGAAKGMVTRYAEGLQHRFARSGVKVVLIKPGPTDTPMTAHLKGQGSKIASVENVAQKIVDAIECGQAKVYVPGKWAVIMMVIRHLPDYFYTKLNI